MTEDWRDEAACRGLTSLFYPNWPKPSGPNTAAGQRRVAAAALIICARCPVRAECLAAHADEDDGVFGGTVPVERRKLTRTGDYRERRTCAVCGGPVSKRSREKCAACRLAQAEYPRPCIECGVTINNGATTGRCQACYARHRRRIIKASRERALERQALARCQVAS